LQGGFRFGLRTWRRQPDCHPSPVLQRAFSLSIRLINAVFSHPPTKGGELFLLVNLARYAAEDGSRVYPSVARLAKETAQHPRAIARQLASLKAKGLIEVVKRSLGRVTEYRVCIEKLCTDPEHGPGYPCPWSRGTSVRGAGDPCSTDRRFVIDSLSIHQNRRTKIKVKTEAGAAALRSMKELLKRI
jgi:hypothetical protein